MLYNLVTQAPTQTATIGNTLQNIANTGLYDHADIAVAYATRSGLGIFDGVLE